MKAFLMGLVLLFVFPCFGEGQMFEGMVHWKTCLKGSDVFVGTAVIKNQEEFWLDECFHVNWNYVSHVNHGKDYIDYIAIYSVNSDSAIYCLKSEPLLDGEHCLKDNN